MTIKNVRPPVLSRRSLLKGIFQGSVISVGLPPLEAMFDANGVRYANGAPIPVRFGIIFFGDGVKKWAARPVVPGVLQGATYPSEYEYTRFGLWQGAQWKLGEEMAALQDVKSHVIVSFGSRMMIGGHHQGASMMTTGTAPVFRSGGGPYSSPGGPSVDHIVAKEIGDSDPFPSIQPGLCSEVNRYEGPTLSASSHTGPNAPVRSTFAPQELFNKLFGGNFMPTTTQDPAKPSPLNPLRRSILDLVRQDVAELKARGLCGADQQRLDQHLTGIRELEKRLMTTVSTASCKAPPMTSLAKVAGNDRQLLIENNKAHAQLVAIALSCQRTKVFSYLHSTGTDFTVYRWHGATGGHHGMTHAGPRPNAAAGQTDRYLYDQPVVHKSTTEKFQHIGAFLKTLKDTPEGAGSLLDNCAIIVCTDVSQGHDHAGTDMPIVLAGKAGGRLKTDSYYLSNREHALRFHVTLFRAMGLKINFGTGSYQESQPIPALLNG